MKTIVRHTPRIAGALIACLITTGTAIAFTREPARDLDKAPVGETIGCFVITPERTTFVAPPATLGQFVVTPKSTRFVPAQNATA